MEYITQRLKLKDVYPDRAREIAKKYKKKADDIELIRKGVTPSEVKAAPEENAIVSYITTKTKDRDNEIVDPEGAILDDYRKNPVVLWGHNYSARELPLGKNLWIKQDEKGLIAKTQYYLKDNFAKRVYEYRKDGFPLAESIGFIPLDWEDFDEKKAADNDGARRKYNKWLLLEYSDVVVPSNPDAVAIAMKQGLVTEEQAKELMVELPEDLPEEKEIEIEDVADDATTNESTEVKLEDSEPDNESVTEENSEVKIEKVESSSEEWSTAEEEKEVTKPEVTENYIRIPVSGEEGKHDGHKIRTIDISKEKGIKALYCVDCKKNITYLFDKEKWTMDTAKEWMAGHKDIEAEVEKEESETQSETQPDIQSDTQSEEEPKAFTIDEVYNIIDENKRLRTAYEILKQQNELLHLKSGVVLNKQNKSDLKQAQELIQRVLDSAEKEELEEEKQQYNCECIECGHQMVSDDHCKDIKCPKCGGEMRRVERPGPGTRMIELEEKEVELPESLPERAKPKAEPDKIEFDKKFVNDLIHEVSELLKLDSGNDDKLIGEYKENTNIERKKALGKVL
jgi:HK97 family phage prohead protease